jgi:hypothetical protein
MVASGLVYLHSLKVVHGDINLVRDYHHLKRRMIRISPSGEHPPHRGRNCTARRLWACHCGRRNTREYDRQQCEYGYDAMDVT